MLELCWFACLARCDGHAKGLLGVSVHTCGEVEFEATIARRDLIDDFVVMQFTRNSDRSGESEICSVDSDDCSIEPFQALALNTALVIQLGRVK